MIARILDSHGVGSATSAIHYIAGEQDHKGESRDDVIHLFGDGQLVIDVTEAMSCKHRYLSSILSFTKEESARLSVDQVRELAESFAEHHAHPFGTNNIAGCAYLHIQDGRYDVHLVQAQHDFESGKRVDLYLDQLGDTQRIADWQDVQNFEHDLDDPRDPARQRLTKERIQEAENRKEMRSLVNARLERMHYNSELKSRADVCQELESLGFVIARQTKSSISISSPDLKQNIRLTGAIYHESYAGITDSRRAIEESQRRTREDRQKQYDAARTRLEQANKKRTARLSKKLKIDLAGRLQETYGNAGAERPDDFYSDDRSLSESRDKYCDSPDAVGIDQCEFICTDELQDDGISGAHLRNSSGEQHSESPRRSVHGQSEVTDGITPSNHEIPDPVSPAGRDQHHAESMRRVSASSRSLELASQRFGRTGDSERPGSKTTRGSLVSAIERVARSVARWIGRLTGDSGRFTPS